MENFLFVEPDLIYMAEVAKNKIQTRFNLSNAVVESLFHPDINYKPTFHWKTKTHIIICDLSSSPFPESIKNFYSEVTVKGLPVKVFIAYPIDRQKDITKYRKELKKAKEYGLGLIALDDDQFHLENLGVSLPLHLPQLDFSIYEKKFRPQIEECFESYMYDGKPKDALQKLGQLVENIILNLALQAQKNGKLTLKALKPGHFLAQSKILDSLISQNILDSGLLGTCKTFSHDRNSVSHTPKNYKEAIKIEKKLRESFLLGLRILETLPPALKRKKYLVKISNA